MKRNLKPMTSLDKKFLLTTINCILQFYFQLALNVILLWQGRINIPRKYYSFNFNLEVCIMYYIGVLYRCIILSFYCIVLQWSTFYKHTALLQSHCSWYRPTSCRPSSCGCSPLLTSSWCRTRWRCLPRPRSSRRPQSCQFRPARCWPLARSCSRRKRSPRRRWCWLRWLQRPRRYRYRERR